MTDRREFIRQGTLAALGTAVSLGNVHAKVSAPVEPFIFRFAVASDGHFGQPETDFVRFHNEITEWLNFEAEGRGLDFVVLNGDLIHDKPEFLPSVKECYEKLTVPYYAVKGNHDKVSAEIWKKTWGYEENHIFEEGDYGFILGTTSNEAGDYLCVDTDWLEEALSKLSGKRMVFAFFHINQHGFTRYGVSCPEVCRILEMTENIAAVFHGHDHDIDNVIYSQNRAYLFDGHVGGNWGTNYRGYRIVEISSGGSVRTYQCNPKAYFENQLDLG
jgi:predicted MPP superfamily phosphohydrolase